jgi:hypothetical protein
MKRPDFGQVRKCVVYVDEAGAQRDRRGVDFVDRESRPETGDADFSQDVNLGSSHTQ